jgi:hypothetical protein
MKNASQHAKRIGRLFLHHLSKYSGDKLLERTDHYTAMQDYELKNRLAKYILQIENNGYFQEKLTETAEYVGVSYRHFDIPAKISTSDIEVTTRQNRRLNQQYLEYNE